MNERMQRILADLKARQEAGEHMACPRCGCDTMKPVIYTNALSRQADIMVVFLLSILEPCVNGSVQW